MNEFKFVAALAVVKAARNDVWDRVASSSGQASLEVIENAASLFEELAAELFTTYVSDWSGLEALLRRARRP